MMALVCLAFLLKCIGLYGRDFSMVYPASQLWFGWTPNITYAKPLTGLFYLIALPFVVSLVYSDTYYIDNNTGMVKNIIVRCKKSKYLLAKGLVVYTSGFIVIFIPLIVEQVLCLFVSPITGRLDILHTKAYEFPFVKYIQFSEMFVNHPYLRNFLIISLASLFGGSISLFSYALSFINKKSRLFVVAFPGILYIAYNLVVEFFDERWLGLSYYLYSSVTFSGRTSYIIIVLAAMTLLSTFIIVSKSMISKDEL